MTFSFRSLALVLVAAVLPLAAQGPRRGEGMRHGARGPLAQLNLTDAQKASFKALRDKYQPSLKTARTTLFEAQKALHAAAANPAAKEADLKPLFDKASEARFALFQQRRAMMQEGQGILTDDQKAQLERMKAQRQERMQQRMEEGGWGPGLGPVGK